MVSGPAWAAGAPPPPPPPRQAPTRPCAPLLAVATFGGAVDLYSAANSRAVEEWLGLAGGVERAAAAWVEPTCQAASPEERGAAKQQLQAALQQLEARLAGSSHLVSGSSWLARRRPPPRAQQGRRCRSATKPCAPARAAQVGDSLTLADVAVLASLAGLYQGVLGQDVQQQYGGVTRWLQATAAQPHCAAVLGESGGVGSVVAGGGRWWWWWWWWWCARARWQARCACCMHPLFSHARCRHQPGGCFLDARATLILTKLARACPAWRGYTRWRQPAHPALPPPPILLSHNSRRAHSALLPPPWCWRPPRCALSCRTPCCACCAAGQVALCQAPAGWAEPAAAEDKKKKKKKGQGGEGAAETPSAEAAGAPAAELDPEKAAKKAAKLAEKEAKKAKAMEKAAAKAAAATAAAAAAAAASDKKAGKKAEAEAKKVLSCFVSCGSLQLAALRSRQLAERPLPSAALGCSCARRPHPGPPRPSPAGGGGCRGAGVGGRRARHARGGEEAAAWRDAQGLHAQGGGGGLVRCPCLPVPCRRAGQDGWGAGERAAA